MVVSLWGVASAGEPVEIGPSPLGEQHEALTEPLTFDLKLQVPERFSCVGPLQAGAPPCRFVATIGTGVGVMLAQILRPVDARLVRASPVSPFAPGRPVLNSGVKTAPGLLFSGFSSDPTFVGLGSFDMRAR